MEESDDDDNEDEDEETPSHEDPLSSCSSDTHPSTGGHSSGSRRSQQGTPDLDPSPSPGQEPSLRGVWPSRRAASPGRRRALFSRRGWKASPRAFSPSSESCSPSRSLSPRLELSSPIHSLSPRTELSSPSRHVSPSPERRPSTVRPLSPLRPVSPSCYQASRVWTPPSPLEAQHKTSGHLPWESPGLKGSHVKLVSPFGFIGIFYTGLFKTFKHGEVIKMKQFSLLFPLGKISVFIHLCPGRASA